MTTGTPPKYLSSWFPLPSPAACCTKPHPALQSRHLSTSGGCRGEQPGCPCHPAFRRACLQHPSERWATAGHRAESQRSAWSTSPSLGRFHSAEVLTNSEVKEEIPTLFYNRWLYLHYKLSTKHPELPWGTPNSLFFFCHLIFSVSLSLKGTLCPVQGLLHKLLSLPQAAVTEG